MPWRRNADLPLVVRSALPIEAQTKWRAVANSVLRQGGSEQDATSAAWSVVHDEYDKPDEEGGEWTPKKISKKREKRSLYVMRPLENRDVLATWAKAQGFPTVQDELHVTVCYSKTPIEWPRPHSEKLTVTNKMNRSVEPLGDTGAVVLHFESPGLEARHLQLRAMGATSDFDGYTPHVTISWNGEGVDLDMVDPYEGELVFGPEVHREIYPDWKDNATEKVLKVAVSKVDDELGLVFGWAIVSKVDGKDYFDVQDDHIPEATMLKAATRFMTGPRAAGEMHREYEAVMPDGSPATVVDKKGTIVFAFPMTTELAGTMLNISGPEKTGLMIAMQPNSDVLSKFKSGEYTGFSIGGLRVEDEEVGG